MTNYYKVTLSPKFDTYLGRNDLEQALSAANLSNLMPNENGRRRAFNRTMLSIEEAHGVKFNVIKETSRDIMWSVHLGNRNLGTYMLLYGLTRAKKLPVFAGTKSRVIDKTRFNTHKQLFFQICSELDSCLYNPGVNGYSVHLRTVEHIKSLADSIEPRQHGMGLETEAKSAYYYLAPKHKQFIEDLASIYSKFQMTVTYTIVQEGEVSI